MISINEAFDFVEGGRTYTCRIEDLHRGAPERWWWLNVTGDRNRYAPFRAVWDDTEDSVRSRMLTYYEERLTRHGGPQTRGFGDRQPRS